MPPGGFDDLVDDLYYASRQFGASASTMSFKIATTEEERFEMELEREREDFFDTRRFEL